MPGQPEEEAQLLRNAQQGEAEAFGLLYERHAAAIFRYLYVHLGNRFEAEDVTGEVFLRAWQALPRYRLRGVPFRAYLFRIAHNALVDHYRHQQHETLPMREEEPSELEEASSPFDSRIGSEDHLELSTMLSGMREDYRTVLALRFLSQLSPAETAAAMQRSTGAVRVLQHRALQALRQKLEEKKEEEI